ncbi:alpha/beta fold hydrolase [Devosia nitrariae]|uniref:Alpha/beta hydrolase n=1 Tax=Devosia nitrariae TaxID=2071872 RepID=A0ABQ5W7N7_9HYPH|nr:alpha/beta hydrolase [Devosia nitrariae]GLQ55992.1 alpha/beta hydrolase [Devosia nitrariae]
MTWENDLPTVTSKDGTVVGYDSKGSGPAIVLVAGATQYRAVDSTTPVMIDLLADRFTIINFDRRGRGESGDTGPYAVAREIDDIATLIDAAAGGKAGLFGMSSGAVLALEAAAALSEKVTGVVMYEPPVDPDQNSETSWQEHAEMAALAETGDAAGMMVKFVTGVGMPPEAVEGFQQSPAWADYEAVGLTLEHDYRIMAEATDGNRAPERWQRARMPVLVIDGDASFPFMKAGADWVAAALPNSTRRTLAGQSHEFDPKVLGSVLAEFFGR